MAGVSLLPVSIDQWNRNVIAFSGCFVERKSPFEIRQGIRSGGFSAWTLCQSIPSIRDNSEMKSLTRLPLLW